MANVTKVTLNSYPKPSDRIALVPLTPRPLPPLTAPSLPAHLPAPPTSRVAHPALADHYVLSTHVVPAALPRLCPAVPVPAPPAFSADKQTFNAAVEAKCNEIVDLKVKHWKGELGEGADTLYWNVVDRYVRKDAPLREDGKGITLFFAHANGFPKEIWEPALIEFLKTNAASKHPLDIVEIWLWEAINHGDSAVMNADKLSGVYDWTENSRDILNFLEYYLPTLPNTQLLPTHLPRLPESLATSRKQFGFQARTFVFVGHSFGGCSGLRAAIETPILFDSIVLVDPIIHPLQPGTELLNGYQYSLVGPAIRRRTKWTSREEAANLFKKSPFFKAWHPDALDMYIKHGIRDDPDGGVSLKMSGIMEAEVFVEALSNAETWLLAESLDPRIELRWIMPGFPTKNGIPKDYLVWLRPENSSNVIIRKAGHLIPQEAPKEFAQELYAFLKKKYGRKSRSKARL